MPLINNSSYKPPFIFRNPHLNTIFASKLRVVKEVRYRRVRIDTPDGDFLDLDISEAGGEKACLLVHGLEGNSRRSYIMGMVRAINYSGWDAVALNLRGCSGESNRLPQFYHAGSTLDIHTTVEFLVKNTNYKKINLVGFSLGGEILLNYLADDSFSHRSQIGGLVAVSVLLDLTAAMTQMSTLGALPYNLRLTRMLKKKVVEKNKIMPEIIRTAPLENINTLVSYDKLYTAPLHGFRDAKDYYSRCSSIGVLSKIRIPTLIINALDDPLLPEESYPLSEAENNKYVFLEMPRYGSHVGFTTASPDNIFWHEKRVLEFFSLTGSLS